MLSLQKAEKTASPSFRQAITSDVSKGHGDGKAAGICDTERWRRGTWQKISFKFFEHVQQSHFILIIAEKINLTLDKGGVNVTSFLKTSKRN